MTELLNALNELYIEACEKKDYVRCNVLRVEIGKLLRAPDVGKVLS